MNREEFHHQNHESRKRLREDRIVVEAERGWAGQHGQHPENDEEENYCPCQSAADQKNSASSGQ
jgi:hypothetical protein